MLKVLECSVSCAKSTTASRPKIKLPHLERIRLLEWRSQHFWTILLQKKHQGAIEAEILNRVSFFQKNLTEKNKVENNVLFMAFSAMYWLAKEGISNEKISTLLNLLEKIGIHELKYFQHRSRASPWYLQYIRPASRKGSSRKGQSCRLFFCLARWFLRCSNHRADDLLCYILEWQLLWH